MNLMQMLALMGQGEGRMPRVGPLGVGARGSVNGGPLARNTGTIANGLPQPVETFDPGASTSPVQHGHMDGRLMGMSSESDLMPAPSLAPPAMTAPSDVDRASVATMPMQGPLAAPAAPEQPSKMRGALSRVGDFFGSDEGKGALFRAGAQLMGGGNVGDAMMAGAGHVESRRNQKMQQEMQEREFGQRDRQLDISQQGTDQSGLYQAGMLQNATNRNMLDVAELEQRAQAAASRLQLDWAKLSQADQQFLRNLELRAMEEEGRMVRHSTVSGSTQYASDSAMARTDKTLAAKDGGAGSNLGQIVRTTGEKKPEEGGWFTEGKPGAPATKTVINIRSLPKTPEELVPGMVYATAKGNARWNGQTFEAVE